jgi:hypothetical protein
VKIFRIKTKKPGSAGAIYFHFTKDFLGNHFFEIPEMKLVNRLLERSSIGIGNIGKTKK